MSTVRDVMTMRVIALKQDADYKEIVHMLRRFRVSACPVISDSGQVVGVVSEADLLYKEADPDLPAGLIRLQWKLGEESKATAVMAGDLMTSPAVTVHPGASVVDAARLMQDRRVKRLPVVGEGGELIGIVSRADVLSAYERLDEDIRDEVLHAIIAGELALDPDGFEVTVTAGIVTLTGVVERTETALRLMARVRHTEGVVAARDRLAIAEASSWSGHPCGRGSPADGAATGTG